MGLLDITRKELRLRRVSTALIFCLTSLALLVAAAMMPRSYSASAELRFDSTIPAIDRIGERLRTRVEDAGAGLPSRIASRMDGNVLEIRVAASRAQDALESVSIVLARVVQQEIEQLRTEFQAREQELHTQVEAALEQVEAAQQRLNAALAALPEGGEAAVGARIGKLQGEAEALALDVRDSGELLQSLGKRAGAIERQIAAMQPALDAPAAKEREIVQARSELALARAQAGSDAARIEAMETAISQLDVELMSLAEKRDEARMRINGQWQPQAQQLRLHMATLRDELEIKKKRRGEIEALLQQTRTESTQLLQGNDEIRALQRNYDDAVALKRPLEMRLQEVQLDIAMRTTIAALPFETARHPVLPTRPDGVPTWLFAVAALLGGVLLALLRLLGGFLVDDKVRLPETIVREVEVPVLAVIPEYRPPQAISRIRWQVIGVALLVAATLVAHLLFLLVIGW